MLVTHNRHDNAARGSMTRGAAELANAIGALSLSRNLGSAGLAIGTTTSKVTLGTTLPYVVNGTYASKASGADVWTLSGTVVAASSFQKYLLLLDASGTASIQEGVQSIVNLANVGWSNVSAVGSYAPLLSILNSGKTIAGYITVSTDATHTFTPGTTALSATGITTTYVNSLCEPTLLPAVANEFGLVVGLGV